MHTFFFRQHTNAIGPRAVRLLCPALLALLAGCRSTQGAATPASQPFDPPARSIALPYRPAARTTGPGGAERALPSTLAEHVRWALEHNPGLGGLAADFAARREAPRRAGALPDPKLALTHYLEPVQTRVGPQRAALGLTQALPWFGTLGLREEAAEQMAEQAGWQWRSGQLLLVRRVRRAWCELTWLGRVTGVLKEHVQLLALHGEAVRSRFTTGDATHDQLMRAGLETARLENRLREVHGRQVPARARLAQTLGTPLPRADTMPADYDDLLGDTLPGQPDVTISADHPELLAARANLERARAQVGLAQRRRYPDLALGLRWIETGDENGLGGNDAGTDPWMATLTLDLPLDRGRIAAGERAARSLQRSATLNLEQTRQSLDARLAATLFDHGDAGRRVTLHREALVPRARAVLEATEASFRTGGARFIDLLDAQRVLLDLELSLETARRDRVLARADLDALLATPIPHILSTASAR
jgi:outer membrane protein TolC